MEHDNFGLDRVGVDGAPVLALVLPLHVMYLQVPLLDVGPHNADSGVIYHSLVLVRQRNEPVIYPRHLKRQVLLHIVSVCLFCVV